MGIDSLGYIQDTTVATNIGSTTSPDPNSVNGQLSTIKGHIDTLEVGIGDTSVSPTQYSLQWWLKSIYDNVAINASPGVNSLLSRVASIVTSVASLLTGLGAIADAQATSDTGSFSVIAFLKLIAARVNRVNTTATTSQPSVTATAATLFTATGKGYKIFNPATSAAGILVREGGTATTTNYSYLLPPGYIYFDEYNYSGTVSAILASGSTTVTPNCTVH